MTEKNVKDLEKKKKKKPACMSELTVEGGRLWGSCWPWSPPPPGLVMRDHRLGFRCSEPAASVLPSSSCPQTPLHA